MGIFGWSYPAGCSGPPDDPDPCPESEAMYVLLEDAGCDQDVIDKACKIVYDLAVKSYADCPACMRAAAIAEAEFYAKSCGTSRQEF